MSRPSVTFVTATMDLAKVRTLHTWERSNLVNANLHPDGTVTIFSEEDGHVIAERWAANPPYRWEWIVGVPVALFASFDYWRTRRARTERLAAEKLAALKAKAVASVPKT